MDVAVSTTELGCRPDRPRLSPMTAFLLAIWIGLCAGFLDDGLILVKKLALNKEEAYRIARDFPWTVPVGHVVLAMVPAAMLAVVSWRRPRWVSLRAGAWFLATLAFWAAFLRLPLYSAASFVLAFGVGKLFSDAVLAFGFGPRVRWARNSLAGFLGLLVLLTAATTGREALLEARAVAGLPPASSKRNVLFIVWDTVRVSNLRLYGYHRQTTPNLSRWSREGVCYAWPLAPAPWTYPSHACFFTGQWPYKINTQWKFTLDTPDPTLAEFLAAQGYQTAGFVANTNCCNYETGLDRGFIHFEDYTLKPQSLLCRTVPGKWLLEQFLTVVNPYERKWADLQSRGAAEVNGTFLGWLDRRRPDRPFFAFLNYFDAHEPYIPPAEFEGRFGARPKSTRDYQFLVDFVGLVKDKISDRDFEMARDCYDDCIAYLDQQLGRLLDELKRRGDLENTVVIITSDHGEGLGEHGICGHSYAVDIQEVGVPLVILAPDASKGQLVPNAVSLRDLPATVTDLLGLARNSPFPGRSLADYWRAPSGETPALQTSPALSEQASEASFRTIPGAAPSQRAFQMSLVAPDGWQYIRTGWGVEMLFDLWRDPRMMQNLIGSPEGDVMVGRLRKMLLDDLKKNRGSAEVEDAYLKAFRRELANLTRADDKRAVAGPPGGGVPSTSAKLSP